LRIQLLATGDFLSVINAAVLYDNAKRWSLTALPIELAKPPPWSVIRLKNRILSPAAQLFIQHLREVAKSVVAADPGRNLQL
jgi:DNA-binding transcriptional LysR family regulator